MRNPTGVPPQGQVFTGQAPMNFNQVPMIAPSAPLELSNTLVTIQDSLYEANGRLHALLDFANGIESKLSKLVKGPSPDASKLFNPPTGDGLQNATRNIHEKLDHLHNILLRISNLIEL